MKKTRRIITASVLSAIICLTCGAMATTVHAAEVDNTVAVSQQESMPILRQGVWHAVGIDGKSEFIEINNSVQTMSIISADKKIGVSAQFEYNWSTGVYTVHAGAYSNIDTWQLTSNSGDKATLTKGNGQGYSLFYMGNGHVKNYYSVEQITAMAKNYFEVNFGDSQDACFVSKLRADGAGDVIVTVYGRDTMHQVIVDTYTINVRTGVGLDSNYNIIDFSCFI